MRKTICLAVAAAGLLGSAVLAAAEWPPRRQIALSELQSGENFATPETRAMQEDDFTQPGLSLG